MNEEKDTWEREFHDIGYPITRSLAGTGDWSLHEIARKPFGMYGLGFSQLQRHIFVRLTMDAPEFPGREFMMESMRRMRSVMRPGQEIRFVPECTYETKDTAMVFMIRTQVESHEDFAVKLDALMEIMDRAVTNLIDRPMDLGD
jgi:hypothetical protein